MEETGNRAVKRYSHATAGLSGVGAGSAQGRWVWAGWEIHAAGAVRHKSASESISWSLAAWESERLVVALITR